MGIKRYSDLSKLSGDKLLEIGCYSLATKAYIREGKKTSWIGKKIGDILVEKGHSHTAAWYYLLGGNKKELKDMYDDLVVKKHWSDDLAVLLTAIAPEVK